MLRSVLRRSSTGSHHDYVGTIGFAPTRAHALTATLTTVCKSERPSELVRRDRLDDLELCILCHPTRPAVPGSSTSTPSSVLGSARGDVGGLGLLALAVALVLVVIIAGPARGDDVSAGCSDEVTGEPGLMNGTGECITPAEYSDRFSSEALAEVPSLDGLGSIADVYGLTSADDPAADRPREFAGVELLTFRELVTLHDRMPV